MPRRVRGFGYAVGLLFLSVAAGDARAEIEGSQASTLEEEAPEGKRGGALSYFGIFYGPSLGAASSLQPTVSGEPDPERPILLKNFLTAGYRLSEDVVASATLHWLHRPVHGQDLSFRDPYLRVAHQGLINSGGLVWYADARAHLAVSAFSRESDLLAGFQTFQILTYQVGTSRLSLGAYGSARYNVYGPQGSGNDLELYLGPNLAYQLTPTLSFSVLYEMGMSHAFGEPPGRMFNDGTDLQPGINWDVTPTLMINPYLNIYTGDKVTLDSTSLGMTLHWQLF
jgi:hypothetical protein